MTGLLAWLRRPKKLRFPNGIPRVPIPQWKFTGYTHEGYETWERP